MKHLTQHMVRTLLLFSVLSIGFLGTTQASVQQPSVYVDQLDPQPVVDWAMMTYRVIEKEKVNAPNGARIYGYVGVTIYESLLNGMPDNLTMAGQIPHMPDMPLPKDETTYDWLTVTNASVSNVLKGLLDKPSDDTLAMMNDLYGAQIDAQTTALSADIVADSVAYGEEIATTILEWVSEDGYDATRGLEYTLPTGDGYWEITTEGATALEPYWGQIRPFVMDYADECAVYMDVPYSTDKDSTFYKQAEEVVAVERELTDDQAETARYWIDSPALTGTPAGHWWSIANQLVEQLNLTLDRAAEMYAMLGVTLADSFISCWSLKYQLLLLRPVTFIQDNIRRSWAPYVETPPFPEYPSGHSVVSAAAADTLTRLFGAQAFEDKTHIIYGHEPLIRSFTSFRAAANEAAISRLYGGIHYRAAIENGMLQGSCVSSTAFARIRLNPVLQGE